LNFARADPGSEVDYYDKHKNNCLAAIYKYGGKKVKKIIYENPLVMTRSMKFNPDAAVKDD